jgi:integrase
MIKKKNGQWVWDTKLGGRNGKRIQKTFKTQVEAKRYEAHIRSEYNKNKDWNMQHQADERRLNDLVDLWYEYHGNRLKDSQGRLSTLRLLVEHLKNPKICNFTKHDFLKYRNSRTDLTPNTINHHHAYLAAVFSELVRLDLLEKNPMQGIKKLRIYEKELAYLTGDQIKLILDTLKQRSIDAYITAKICLSVGTRWSEAVGIKTRNIVNKRINLTNTKNGKIRQLPLTEELALEIRENAPFKDGYSTFGRIIKDLKIETPKGQLTHILRHSFASHFMMNGGDILTLQKTLGHSDLKMTMRYAHLSPEHLEKITKLNPISSLNYL